MIYVLSGGAKAFAVIGVTYPAGSTCTCTYGTKTLALKDTSGNGFFLIPYAGTWTVTATDGTNTKSESVTVAEGEDKIINLSYDFVIIDGTACRSDFEALFYQPGTGSWGPGTGCYLYVSPNGGYGIVQGKYDLTNYKALKITLKSTSGAAYNGYKWIGVNGTSVSATDPVADIAQTTIPASATNTTYTVDLSNVTGEKYIILAGTANPGSVTYEITKLWLE